MDVFCRLLLTWMEVGEPKEAVVVGVEVAQPGAAIAMAGSKRQSRYAVKKQILFKRLRKCLNVFCIIFSLPDTFQWPNTGNGADGFLPVDTEIRMTLSSVRKGDGDTVFRFGIVKIGESIESDW